MDLRIVNKVIAVQSSNIDLGEAFREFATQSILRTTIKYFGQLNTAAVHVSREGPMFRCTVNVQLSGLKMMLAEFQHEDCYQAFKSALEKIETQLRRAKRELRGNRASRVDKDRVLRDGLEAPPAM